MHRYAFKPGTTVTVIVILGVIVLGAFSAIIIKGVRLAERYAPLVDATMEIKYESTAALLLLEKSIARKDIETLAEVHHRIDNADWYIGAMLVGGTNAEGTFLPVAGDDMRTNIRRMRDSLDTVRRAVQRRIDSPGAPAANALNAAHDRFIAMVDDVETDLQAAAKRTLTSFFITAGATAAVIAGLFIAAVFYSLRALRTNRRAMDDLAIEHARAEATARYLETTMRSMGDALIITDTAGRIMQMNPKAIELTGWAAEQSRDRWIKDVFVIVHEETLEPAEDLVERVMTTGETQGLANHTILIARDGRRLSIADSAAPIVTDEGTIIGVVIIFHDVTENRTYQRELESVNRDLAVRAAKEAKRRIRNEQMLFEQKKFVDMGQMVNAIAHQWRQPLNALSLSLGYIQELTNRDRLNTAEAESTLAQGEKIIQLMSRTIDDFRLFFAPSGHKENFEPAGAIRGVLNLVGTQLSAHGINYSLSCTCMCGQTHRMKDTALQSSGETSVTIRGFPVEFKQVVMNLVSNAKDAILETRQADGRGRITFDIVCQPDMVTITVEDDGGGIPEEYLAKVFEPYFTGKPEGRGTGIGLYMSKLVIEDNMGGSIRAENAGAGARIIMTLPAGDSMEQGEHDHDERQTIEGHDRDIHRG